MRYLSLFFFFPLFSFGQTDEWTWVKGDNLANQPGHYGTRGVSGPLNNPRGRYGACQWKDGQGNFWIFGGGLTASFNDFNDLWRYSPASGEWTWMGGDTIYNQAGIYGTPSIPSPSNKPGARSIGFPSWVDNNGNLWMFSGSGYDMFGQFGSLTDLWKYNPSIGQWAWMGGSPIANQPGVYGTKGVASSSNLPPGRTETVCAWVDNAGNLWMFGGYSFDANSNTNVFLNDLWKYDITANQWTWMSGDNISSGSQVGVYGTKGIPAPTNKPGGRWCYANWKDVNGNFWLMGGEVWDGTMGSVYNDMWRYDVGTNEWTWMSGSNTGLQPNIFGTQCIDSSGVVPGATMENRVNWTDPCGNFWTFGTNGVNSLFNYNTVTNKWTWIRGSGSLPVYGTMNVSSPNNTPSPRTGSVGWIDNNGMWLFGGAGYDASNTNGDLNDLWKYVPDTLCAGCNIINAGTHGHAKTDGIFVYPNPANAQVTIWIDLPIAHVEYEMRIYNSHGELVFTAHSLDKITKIDVSAFSKGIYLISCSGEGSCWSKKIIVQ